MYLDFVPVAQLDRALASGAKGCGFKSPQARILERIFPTGMTGGLEAESAAATEGRKARRKPGGRRTGRVWRSAEGAGEDKSPPARILFSIRECLGRPCLAKARRAPRVPSFADPSSPFLP